MHARSDRTRDDAAAQARRNLIDHLRSIRRRREAREAPYGDTELQVSSLSASRLDPGGRTPHLSSNVAMRRVSIEDEEKVD
uniref:Uncharacterized protein n=1 Tax=viral metagenome TaxID=1070528 RepID=A0A6C0C1Y5_9ZZZZ